MPLSNSPDPAVREAEVQQDLGNVLHPIIQHKTLETKQMVVTGGEGSSRSRRRTRNRHGRSMMLFADMSDRCLPPHAGTDGLQTRRWRRVDFEPLVPL